MEKVYVIGASQLTDAEIIANAALAIDVEIVRVNSIEDVPLTERIRSNRNSVVEMHKIQIVPDTMGYEQDFKPTHKGHERPYKYHR